jgi:archaellum component FlaC
MLYTDKLRQSIKNVEEELKKSTEELDNLEKELANVIVAVEVLSWEYERLGEEL